MFGKSSAHSATASGYTKCGSCSEWGRCRCPKQETKTPAEIAQEKKDAYRAEVKKLDQDMARSAKFVRGSRWR